MSQISSAFGMGCRLEIMLAGGIAPNSPLHVLYVSLDVANLLALLTCGAGLLSRRGNRGCNRA